MMLITLKDWLIHLHCLITKAAVLWMYMPNNGQIFPTLINPENVNKPINLDKNDGLGYTKYINRAQMVYQIWTDGIYVSCYIEN
ncbi:hypothetical protein BX070DRAFT_231397, partial [Coemansia spiralis]